MSHSLTVGQNQFLVRVAAVAMFVSALLLSSNAAAEDYVVTYKHAELTNAQGVADVHNRIVKAAKRYCPTYSQIRSNQEVQDCINDVVEDLVSKVNHPQLTSLHESGSAVSIAEADATAIGSRG